MELGQQEWAQTVVSPKPKQNYLHWTRLVIVKDQYPHFVYPIKKHPPVLHKFVCFQMS